MSIVGARFARELCHVICGRRYPAGLMLRAPKWLAACIILCSASLAGCARNQPQREISAAPREVKPPAPVRKVVYVRRQAEPVRYSAPQIHRPDAALMSPQPAPDCDFGRSDLKTVDPDQWARLKAEYERQCYRDAEKVARERLGALQSAATCEIEPPKARTAVK
jgi:hypothetical protein